MGSRKYPNENEYDSFISRSGGSSNAFTECQYTLYHFDIFPEHLEKVGSDIVSSHFSLDMADLEGIPIPFVLRVLDLIIVPRSDVT